MYYHSQNQGWRRLIFIVGLLVGGMGLYLALTRIEPLSRRVETIPYYAETYINKIRPKPELPPPPAVSAIDRETLLQPRQPGPAADSAAAVGGAGQPTGQGEAEVQLVESTTMQVAPPAAQLELGGFTHEWQSWNNCGPVTIAMNLSYYGRSETQLQAAQFLKPNEEDKNVNPQELAAYARSLGFETFTGVGGDTLLLKRLLSNGLPVIVETWAEPEDNGGMGHYRLLSGYDGAGNFIAQDSLHGPNITVPIERFDTFWSYFNHKYLLVYQPEQAGLVYAILGRRAVDTVMYEQALYQAQAEADLNPNSALAWFSLATNYMHLNEPERAASAFDEARRLGLPYRMLWYQFEIFEAYLAVGRYQEVVELTDSLLKATGGLEELYYYRGLAHQALDRSQAAAADFRAALEYNANYTPAMEALNSL